MNGYTYIQENVPDKNYSKKQYIFTSLKVIEKVEQYFEVHNCD